MGRSFRGVVRVLYFGEKNIHENNLRSYISFVF
jgi:hypothetical protein